MTTKREQLKTLRERFDELTEALAHVNPRKRGTDWERTRVQHRDFVRKQIERLEGDIPPVPSYSPGDDPLYEGLADDDQAEPARPVRSARRFQPSPEDEAARLEMLAAGMFRGPTL